MTLPDPEVPWRSVAALFPTCEPAPGAMPFSFVNGVELVGIPPWARSSALTDLLGARHRRFLGTECTHVLVTEYKASSLGQLDPAAPRGRSKSVQESAHTRIGETNVACWLAGVDCLGYELLLDFDMPEDEWSMRHVAVTNPVRRTSENMPCLLSSEAATTANQLLAVLPHVAQRSALAFAIGCLWRALTADFGPTRFLFIWIGLEALFGSQGVELSLRLRLRIALFLGISEADARELFRKVKSGYETRSRLVHGAWPSMKEPEQLELLRISEALIRRSLVKILRDTELASVFSSQRREEYLEDLPFTGRVWSAAAASHTSSSLSRMEVSHGG